jgi:hypothetical protein
VTVLRGEGMALGFVGPLRIAVLAGAALWSLWLAWQIAGPVRGISDTTRGRAHSPCCQSAECIDAEQKLDLSGGVAIRRRRADLRRGAPQINQLSTI